MLTIAIQVKDIDVESGVGMMKQNQKNWYLCLWENIRKNANCY